jgi:hypothetical protein
MTRAIFCFQIASAGAAIAAAWFWLKSADLPEYGLGIEAEMHANGALLWMEQGAQMNRTAALCAGIAALLGAAATITDVIDNFLRR